MVETINVELPGVEEFEEELFKDKEFVDRGIVRAVIRRIPVKGVPYAYYYMVELSVVVCISGKDKIIGTSIYCGDTWKDINGKVISGEGEEKSVRTLEGVTKKFEELGFDVRPGRFVAEM